MQYGDLVAVNGKPAKGLWNNTFIIAPLRISPMPGQPIADVNSTGIVQCFFHFLAPDGTFVGTLADRGQETGAGHIIESGTGAFFGSSAILVQSWSRPGGYRGHIRQHAGA